MKFSHSKIVQIYPSSLYNILGLTRTILVFDQFWIKLLTIDLTTAKIKKKKQKKCWYNSNAMMIYTTFSIE